MNDETWRVYPQWFVDVAMVGGSELLGSLLIAGLVVVLWWFGCGGLKRWRGAQPLTNESPGSDATKRSETQQVEELVA